MYSVTTVMSNCYHVLLTIMKRFVHKRVIHQYKVIIMIPYTFVFFIIYLYIDVTIGGVPYMKCRHCSVSLLSCSVKYHERICPQNPIPFIPARIPLRIPQPTNNPYWNPTQITPQDSLRNSQGIYTAIYIN